MHPGSGSLSDLGAAKARRNEKDALIQRALAWCVEHSKGAKACIRAGIIGKQHHSSLDRALRAARSSLATDVASGIPPRHDDPRKVLVEEEEELMVVFCSVCAQQGASVTHEELSRAVVELLRLRDLRNQQAGDTGQQVFPLSDPAVEALRKGAISRHWSNSFFTRHSEDVRWAWVGTGDAAEPLICLGWSP